MRLEEFTYLPLDVKEKALRYLANMMGEPERPLDQLTADLERALDRAVRGGLFSYLREEQPVEDRARADAVLFPTGHTTPTGEEILAKCILNKNPNRQPWFGLFFQAARREGFVIGDLYFRTWNEGARFLEELASMAIPERWNYSQYQSKQQHPILKSYVEKTYERLKQQGRVLRNESKLLFNTGLLNVYFKEIYVLGEADPEYPQRVINARPVLENDRAVLELFLNQKPPMATYFDRITDVIFDPDLEINTDDIHIIDDNFDRIPPKYRNRKKSEIFALFQAAIEFARIMARRNYKLVVPQYYMGQIQFLMPIYLSGEFSGPPDFALVLQKMGDVYRGNTILTLDMAYQNARLIAKPDTTWLSPDKF
ncbi:DUF3825 domain-containing protein [Symbiobacterium thermophilum]|uniref:DUF3825 domain-containing protein n=1 Tax=Symbiobacterium thermophilum (strain DSM 24528 / JCM 14929 / IAM 14863 / T) TaxID=292459 RepID=Q67RU3_SYMTH|nr:DUF3825 domain-containing protein [Symbiobacterium thermophilum]BAD39600.1 hypothetical protein STH615 [Symbiobacterium thermophilum IAM 14863]